MTKQRKKYLRVSLPDLIRDGRSSAKLTQAETLKKCRVTGPGMTDMPYPLFNSCTETLYLSCLLGSVFFPRFKDHAISQRNYCKSTLIKDKMYTETEEL